MLRTLIPARKSEDKYLASMGRVGNRQYHAQSVQLRPWQTPFVTLVAKYMTCVGADFKAARIGQICMNVAARFLNDAPKLPLLDDTIKLEISEAPQEPTKVLKFYEQQYHNCL